MELTSSSTKESRMTAAKNSKSGRRRKIGTPARSHNAAVIHRGYTDAAAGAGYPSDYDAMPNQDQRNYELGRYYSALSRAANGRPAPWPRNRLLRLEGVPMAAWKAEIALVAA